MSREAAENYIRKQREQGYDDTQIRQSLQKAGWSESQIAEAFGAVSQVAGASQSNLPTTPLLQTSSQRLLGPWELFKKAVKVFFSKVWLFLGIAALPAGITLLSLVFLYLFVPPVTATPESLSGIFPVWGLLVALIVGLVLLVVQLWSSLATIYAISRLGEKLGVLQAYQEVWSRLKSYGWLISLVMLVSAGGYLLLFIPGIIIAVWLSLAIYVWLEEDAGLFEVLQKSREYVRDYWWAVFGRFLSLALIMLGLLLLLTIPIAILVLFLSWIKIGSLDLGQQIISFGLSATATPVTAAYGYLLYRNLREIKGRVDVTSESATWFKIFAGLGVLAIVMIPGILVVSMF